MTDIKEKLWPYKRQLAFLAIPLIWVAFALAFVAGQRLGAWKGEVAGQTVLIVAITSIIPLLMVVLDFFVLSGAVIDTKWVKLDFSKMQHQGPGGGAMRGFELPENAGVTGAPISHTSPMDIQKTLEIATHHPIAVANIKSGNAWWVTRLLLLCEGAMRTGSPEILVFLGKKEHVLDFYLGYAKPADLLRAIVSEQKYGVRYDNAVAATKEFMSYKSIKDLLPLTSITIPLLASRYATPQYLALGDEVAEQILLDNLVNQLLTGGSLEEPPDRITISRLNELFDSCLYHDQVDLEAKGEQQVKQLFAAKGEYVALVRKGVYSSLLKKKDGEELILRQLALPKEETV